MEPYVMLFGSAVLSILALDRQAREAERTKHTRW